MEDEPRKQNAHKRRPSKHLSSPPKDSNMVEKASTASTTPLRSTTSTNRNKVSPTSTTGQKTQSQGQMSGETPRRNGKKNNSTNGLSTRSHRYMQPTQARARSNAGGRPGGRTNGRGGRGYSRHSTLHKNSSQPISYSNAARLSGSAGQNDDQTRELQADRASFESGGAVKSLADELFANGTGISDMELRKLVDCKQQPSSMTPFQTEETISKLRNALSSLMQAKKKLASGAIDAEKEARLGWSKALQQAQSMDDDRTVLKNKVKQLEVDRGIWKDNAKDSMRELGVAEEKVQALKDEMEPLKEKLAIAEQCRTEAMIALEVTKARSEAQIKQAEGWKEEIAALEASKAEAVKQAKADAAGATDIEMAQLKDELGIQKARVTVLQSQLQKKEVELQKAAVEKDAAVERASSKDRDLSELMKSLGDIQRSGQSREEEANKLRKEAESKASDLERSLAESRGEINMLTHEKATLAESLESVKKELVDAGGSVKDLKSQLDGFRAELTSQSAQLQLEKELRARSEQKESEERTERIALSAQMVAMTKEHAQMEAQLNEANEVLEHKWRKQFESQEELIQTKEHELAESKETIAGLEGELLSLKEALNDKKSMADAQHVEEICKLRGEINVLKERVKAEEQKLVSAETAFAVERQDFEAQLRDGQAERRKMHNTIQELRGNVRVFARVRPFLPVDGVDDDATMCVVPKSETTLKLHLNGDEKKDYNFAFDRVFAPSSSQEAVFQEVSEFVQSSLDGFNVCLFSYGQTGSGKTHTMQGSGLGQMRGIIPRAIEQVGRYKKDLEAQGWEYEMKVSFLEIYNETIRDLLRDEESGEMKHDIKVHTDGRRYVTNLTMQTLEPSDTDAVNDVMHKAAKQRSVGSTDMNDVSSRSHSVFTLHLTALHPENKQALRGTLNLVDLAGSERLKRSGATGEQAKEAMAINRSLSSLTNVFVAIGTKAGHVPFRNSKLTYLLQPSLSGDGKTLMVVNLSPTEMSTQESLSSLRFASQVNKCELGKAKRSIEEVNSDDDDSSSSPKSSSGRSTPTRTGIVTPRKRLDASSRTNSMPMSSGSKSRSSSSIPKVSSTNSISRRNGSSSSLARPTSGTRTPPKSGMRTPPSRIPRKGSSTTLNR